jgi:hypothetical protein
MPHQKQGAPAPNPPVQPVSDHDASLVKGGFGPRTSGPRTTLDKLASNHNQTLRLG